jgi:hypothetical protein
MRVVGKGRLLQHRIEIHDRKQVELKLELLPSGTEKFAKYGVELFFHVPGSLYITSETYPKSEVYGGVHNYVRLKTPPLTFAELARSSASPLVRLETLTSPEAMAASEGGRLDEGELILTAKLFACTVRGALRRFATRARRMAGSKKRRECPQSLHEEAREARHALTDLFGRYRTWVQATAPHLKELRTRTALALVDEYLSLSLEQFFRMVVTRLERFTHDASWSELRRFMLQAVLDEEAYRRSQGYPSILSMSGDNEAYMHRVGMLKKFCMHALFLSATRTHRRRNVEEILLALAAGVAMLLATVIGAVAQLRLNELSSSFMMVLIVAYMMKDRTKEAMRRLAARFASEHFFDRTYDIHRVSGGERIAKGQERVGYLNPTMVPHELQLLRHEDELVWATEGDLTETILRYQKEIVANVETLPRWGDGPSGVTDILRFSVDRFLRDMDEPEFELEYVDAEDLSVGRVRAAKAYPVDLACRITAEEGGRKEIVTQVVRLVLDRNGIKRMDLLQSSDESVLAAEAAGQHPVATDVPHFA